MWVDKSACYHCNYHFKVSLDYGFYQYFTYHLQKFHQYSLEVPRCHMVFIYNEGRYFPVKCYFPLCSAYICEFESKEIQFPKSVHMKIQFKVIDNLPQHNLVACPFGHLTYEFLHCDVKSYCVNLFSHDTCRQSSDTRNKNVTDHKDGLRVEMFECEETRETIPYTLVCDFRHHCLDGADEHFCVHPKHQHGFRLVLTINNQKWNNMT